MGNQSKFPHFCPTCRRHYEAERTICPGDGSRLLLVPLQHPRPGNVFDSRYVLLETIGKGGMATIYRGYDAQLRRQCALKVLKMKFSSEERAVGQFFTEARMARRLRHPNIVPISDFGRTEVGYLYIAMELLKGETLARTIRKDGPLEPGRALGILGQVMEGLAAAHAQGTIHRDLKPENIFVSTIGGRDIVRILDFGIAQFAGSTNISSREVCGTPAYMSPEQIRGKEALPQSDIYSAGIMLFEMLAGRPPFTGATPLEIMKRHIKVSPPAIGEVNPDVAVSEPLQKMVYRLMLKKVKFRPASAQMVLAAIGELSESSAGKSGRAGHVESGESSGISLGVVRDPAEDLPMISYGTAADAEGDAEGRTLKTISSKSEGMQALVDSQVRPAILLEEGHSIRLDIEEDSAPEMVEPVSDKPTNWGCLAERYCLLHVRFVPVFEEEEDVSEELRCMIADPLEEWFEDVQQAGGLICYDSGEDVKVLFGYLSEDACFARTALRLARDLSVLMENVVQADGIPCGIRAGVATGLVYSDTNVDGPLDWLIKGSQLDFSMRLSRIAPVGGVVMCQDTALEAQPDAQVLELARINARGNRSVQTYLLQGLAAQVAQSDGALTAASIVSDDAEPDVVVPAPGTDHPTIHA